MEPKKYIQSIVQNGGRVLLVGGGLAKLPIAYHEHPRIMVWDDEVEGIQNRTIPATVKVIMWSRRISHATTIRLNNAVQGLHAIKFPMMKVRDIKNLLSEVIPVGPEYSVNGVEIDEEPITKTEFIPLTKPEVKVERVKETVMVKRNTVKSGSVKNLVINNIGPDVDFSKRGSIAKEARRLMVIAKADGLETTEGSINQAIRAHLIKSAKETTELVNAPLEKSRRETVKPLGLSKNDDFDELDKMLVDAVAAMKLIQEHMPKVKKEVEKLRVLREKMLTLLS